MNNLDARKWPRQTNKNICHTSAKTDADFDTIILARCIDIFIMLFSKQNQKQWQGEVRQTSAAFLRFGNGAPASFKAVKAILSPYLPAILSP